MSHGLSLFQCLGVHELCRVLPFLTLPWSTGWAGNLPGYDVKRSQQRTPSDGGCTSLGWKMIQWNSPPEQALMQTVLHLAAVICIWGLSCLLKGKRKTKAGDGELLWEQRHPWQRWSRHRHKHRHRRFWACKGLKSILPWERSLHVYWTTHTCCYVPQIGVFLKNSLLACFCSM